MYLGQQTNLLGYLRTPCVNFNEISLNEKYVCVMILHTTEINAYYVHIYIHYCIEF